MSLFDQEAVSSSLSPKVMLTVGKALFPQKAVSSSLLHLVTLKIGMALLDQKADLIFLSQSEFLMA